MMIPVFAVMKLSLLVLVILGSASMGWAWLVERRLTFSAAVSLIILPVGLFLAAYALWIEPNWIAVERVTIHDQDLAQVVGNTKIVQISDIHLKEGIGYREEQMVKKINALNPDIIFFSGDIIDDLSQIEPAIELFQDLEAKLGLYAVPGNTDHIFLRSHEFTQKFRSAGINMLINETRRLRLPNNQDLWIVGIDDPKYRYDDIDSALKGIPPQVPKIALAHSPSIFDQAVRRNINLVLAGDTHGGQVGIDFLIRLSDYANQTPYMRGLFKKGKTQMYVNRGIGMKTLPIRFLSRPEISIIEVKP